jgi:hypothetical protein
VKLGENKPSSKGERAKREKTNKDKEREGEWEGEGGERRSNGEA